jgi:hypothetical protein
MIPIKRRTYKRRIASPQIESTIIDDEWVDIRKAVEAIGIIYFSFNILLNKNKKNKINLRDSA